MSHVVLIVDDERHIVRLVQIMLERSGYQCLAAFDGVQALETLAREHVDFMTLDIMMPRMDGLEVLKKVKADPALAHVKVIMLTAKAQAQDVMRGWQAGVDAYLTKPFNPTEIVKFIRQLEEQDGLPTEGETALADAASSAPAAPSPTVREQPMPTGTVTWCHLSDLQMPAPMAAEQQRLLTALWDDLREQLAEATPDFVALSGDLAAAGQAAGYALAEREFVDPLLAATGLPLDRLIVAPGNHDSDLAVAATLKQPADPSALTRSDRRAYLTPFSAFQAFVASYAPDPLPAEDEFVAFRRLDTPVGAVGLLTLNTAWLTGVTGRSARTEEAAVAQAALGLSSERVADLLAQMSGEVVTLAVMHHPLSHLARVPEVAPVHLLLQHCQFVLCGHCHEERVTVSKPLHGDLIQIPAGALALSEGQPNTYTVARYEAATGRIQLALRRYDAATGRWGADALSAGHDSGQLEFQVGTLRGITRFVEDEDLPVRPDERGESSSETRHPPSAQLRDYDLEFTNACKSTLQRLDLTEEQLVELVQLEFRSHINYLRFDLEHYPLPVRAEFIVYLDKVGNLIRFRDVAPCTADLAMLSAWHDILAVYRGATRLKYREDPAALLRSPGFLARVLGVHSELANRLTNYFIQFWQMPDPTAVIGYEQLVRHRPDVSWEERWSKSGLRPPTDRERMIAFQIGQSAQARTHAGEIWQQLEQGDISTQDALEEVVMGLENSLQYLHKIILEHSPTAGAEGGERA